MGTYTTNKDLYMPSIGEQGWGDLVNTNFSTVDTFLKPITVSGSTYTFTGNHVGNQSGGTITATKITNSGTLTQTGTSTFTGKITANGGIGTKALTATSISNSGTLTQTGTSTFTGKITANGGVNDYDERLDNIESANGSVLVKSLSTTAPTFKVCSIGSTTTATGGYSGGLSINYENGVHVATRYENDYFYVPYTDAELIEIGGYVTGVIKLTLGDPGVAGYSITLKVIDTTTSETVLSSSFTISANSTVTRTFQARIGHTYTVAHPKPSYGMYMTAYANNLEYYIA